MTLLAEIETFPSAMREVLETSFGIGSAEAFYEHAIRNPTGLAMALSISPQQLSPLAQLIEGYLPAAFLTRCHKPVRKRKRGVIVPEERTESR